MDANIGKLIEYLKAKNLYDNTLIIFLSDNGPEGNTMKMGPPWDNSKFEDWGKKGTFIQYGAAWAQVSAGPFRMIAIDDAHTLLRVQEGRVTNVVQGPFITPNYSFCLRASRDVWQKFWQPLPPRGYTDIFALVKQKLMARIARLPLV